METFGRCLPLESGKVCTLFYNYALKRHPIDNAVESTQQNGFGAKFLVRCTVRTPDGRNPCILTVWMVDGPGAARFVTALPG